ncbi:hypothetical protein [Paenibacillus amylolyticus]|uniref:hypothetical protein n=1 Tax=Paenibacillus amylolyticus TaxID=1451 RepID=UPI003D95652A
MDFLTSSILSGLAWDSIKKVGFVTSEYLKKHLKNWALDEREYENIATKINEIPDEYKKSVKFLEAAIDDDMELKEILMLAKPRSTYAQDNSRSSFNNSQVINGSGNTITINSDNKKKAEIKIIDLEILEADDEEKFPILDVKLRNIGDEVAFLKRVVFNIHDFYEMINPHAIYFDRIESSYTYDMLLSGLETKNYTISQSVGPNGVDRFRLRIANDLGDPIMPTIYKFDIQVVYNEDNLYVNSEKIILPIPSTEEYAGYYISHTIKENAKQNYINLKRFNEDQARKSGYFTGIYDSYESHKSDFLQVK